MKTKIFKISLSALFIIGLSGCGGDSSLDFLIPAKDNKKGDYGFVDLNGKIVLDFDLDMKKEPTIMHEGFSLYPVKKNDIETFHFINEKGEVTQTQYSDALLFNEDLALVVEKMGKLKYINTKFDDVLILEDIQEAGYFFNGLAKFKNNEGKWGFIDPTGKKVIKGKYDYVESFNEGYAMVRERDPDTKANKRGIIDTKGTEIIKLREKYSSLSGFHDGLAAYEENNEAGYLNTKGQEVIKNDDWSAVLPFHDGYASVKENGDWGLINEKGEFVIRPRYDYPLYFINDLAVVYENREYGYIDMEKEEVIDIDFKQALPFLGKGAFVMDGNEWIYINKKGDESGSFSLDYLQTDFLWFIREKGYAFNTEETIESNYVDVDGFLNAVVQKTISKNTLTQLESLTVKDAIENIEQWASSFMKDEPVTTESLIKELGSSSEINSQKLLYNNRFAYDNNFTFEVTYSFNEGVSKNIIKKVKYKYYTEDKVIGREPNLDAIFDAKKGFTLEVHFNEKARNKEMYIMTNIVDYLTGEGFHFATEKDWRESKRFKMYNDNMEISCAYSYKYCAFSVKSSDKSLN